MMSTIQTILSLFLCSCLAMPCLGAAKEDAEPRVEGPGTITLIQGSSLKGWEVPSDHWSIAGGTISGDTRSKKLTEPEWLYTKQSFGDFLFTCEVKLTGPESPNSGIYFRAKKIPYKNRKGTIKYDAATGYEYDLVPGKYFGSIGDWYSRPRFRIFANKQTLDKTYQANKWNRVTLRARGNRLEYWLNGTKIQDYRDENPNGSRKGLIGLQLHDRIVMKAEFRNARVLPLD